MSGIRSLRRESQGDKNHIWNGASTPHTRRRTSVARNIFVEELVHTPIEEQGDEIVERKGIGHPDSIADGLAETVSVALCKMYKERFGRILHLAGGRWRFPGRDEYVRGNLLGRVRRSARDAVSGCRPERQRPVEQLPERARRQPVSSGLSG